MLFCSFHRILICSFGRIPLCSFSVVISDESQIELAEFIKQISQRGAYVLASNSDPKNTNPEDNFFDELYTGMNIERISAKRMINSTGNLRNKKISELLIKNYQTKVEI